MIPDKWICAALCLAVVLIAVFFVLLASMPKVATDGCQDCAALEPAAQPVQPMEPQPEPAKPEPTPEPEPEPVVDNPILQPVDPFTPEPILPVTVPACCHSCEDCKSNCGPGKRLCCKTCDGAPLNVPYACEQCGGTIYVGYADKANVLPAYQCYRCPGSPNGRKPLMYRADVVKPRAAQPQPTRQWTPVFNGRFFGGFGDISNGQACIGST